MLTAPFVIYALPRSRTFWTSRFLTHSGWTCGHDTAIAMRGLDDIRSALRTPLLGSVETAAAPWWRLVHAECPAIRTAVIRRPVEDCLSSVLSAGEPGVDEDAMRRLLTRLDAKLDQVERRVPGVLSVPYSDLDTENGCARLYEHCLQRPHDASWWHAMAPLNLTINFPAQVRYCAANGPQIDRLAGFATQAIRTGLTRRHRATSDALEFQEEPFGTFVQDGRALIAQHHVATGFPADQVGRMNLDLMGRLGDLGVLTVATARCNGRMAGYLMTITAPSLEGPDKLEAHHTAFLSDPSFPGVGAKLQRFAAQAAEARGADVIYLRAGTRGDGPRLGALYRRLGAEPFGELFALNI